MRQRPYRSKPSFNPTLVRLRPARDDPLSHSDHQFQSHAGSIEALPSGISSSTELEFQSHAGSIEAPQQQRATELRR